MKKPITYILGAAAIFCLCLAGCDAEPINVQFQANVAGMFGFGLCLLAIDKIHRRG